MFRSARLAVPLALVAGLLAPATAGAAGAPPTGGVDTSALGIGVSSSEGTSYFTQPSRGKTLLLKVGPERADLLRGRLRVARLPAGLWVPSVAGDGTPAGLSADGRTLVLVKDIYAFPRRESEFTVVDTADLTVAGEISLEGSFSFDAISPDGSTIYLAHHLDPRDVTAYEVRAYDVATERLLADPIVDTETVELTMRGSPLTRETGPGGRWEYTLYDGGRGVPFVHVLDTVDGEARCIALGHLGSSGPRKAAMSLGGDGTLTVYRDRSVPIATVDTGDWSVGDPRGAAAEDAGGNDGWLPGANLLVGFALILLGAGALLLALRSLRRRRAAGELPPDPAPPGDRYAGLDMEGQRHARRDGEPGSADAEAVADRG